MADKGVVFRSLVQKLQPSFEQWGGISLNIFNRRDTYKWGHLLWVKKTVLQALSFGLSGSVSPPPDKTIQFIPYWVAWPHHSLSPPVAPKMQSEHQGVTWAWWPLKLSEPRPSSLPPWPLSLVLLTSPQQSAQVPCCFFRQVFTCWDALSKSSFSVSFWNLQRREIIIVKKLRSQRWRCQQTVTSERPFLIHWSVPYDCVLRWGRLQGS